jgi:hypothetical protein
MNRYRAAAFQVTPAARRSVVLRLPDLKMALITLGIFVAPALFTKR